MRLRTRLSLLAIILGLAIVLFLRGNGSSVWAASMQNVVVYEGLPHQNMEVELMQKERQSKQTLMIDEFYFYAEPLTFDSADMAELKDLLGDSSMYSKYRGPKKCGGFHPDYAVRWENNRGTFTALICFGCNEIKIVGSNGSELSDMGPPLGKLSKLLRKYRKNRPAEQIDGGLVRPKD